MMNKFNNIIRLSRISNGFCLRLLGLSLSFLVIATIYFSSDMNDNVNKVKLWSSISSTEDILPQLNVIQANESQINEKYERFLGVLQKNLDNNQKSTTSLSKVDNFHDKITFPLGLMTQVVDKKYLDSFISHSSFDPNSDTSIKQLAKTDGRLYFYMLLEDLDTYFKAMKDFNYVNDSKSFKVKFRWADLVFNFSPHLNYFEYEGFDKWEESVHKFVSNTETFRAPLVYATDTGEMNNITCALILDRIALVNNLKITSEETNIDCKSINEGLSFNYFKYLERPSSASLYWISNRLDYKFKKNPLTYFNVDNLDYIKLINYNYRIADMAQPSQFLILDDILGTFKVPVNEDSGSHTYYYSYYFRRLQSYIEKLGMNSFPENLNRLFGGINPKKKLRSHQELVRDDNLQSCFPHLNIDTQFIPPIKAPGIMKTERINDSQFEYSLQQVRHMFQSTNSTRDDINYEQSLLEKFSSHIDTNVLNYEDLNFIELDELGLFPSSGYLASQRSKQKLGKYIPQYFQEEVFNYSHRNFDWRFCQGVGISMDQMLFINNRLLRSWFKFTRQLNISSWISGNDYYTLKNWEAYGILNADTSVNPVNMEISFQSLLRLIKENYNYTILYDGTFDDKNYANAKVLDLGSTAFLLDINPYFTNRKNKQANWQNVVDARLIDIGSGLFININALVKLSWDEETIDEFTNWSGLDQFGLLKLHDNNKSMRINEIIYQCTKQISADQTDRPFPETAIISGESMARLESSNDCVQGLTNNLPKYREEFLKNMSDAVSAGQPPSIYHDKNNNFEYLQYGEQFTVIPVLLDGMIVYIPKSYARHLLINEPPNYKEDRVVNTGYDESIYQTMKEQHAEQMLVLSSFTDDEHVPALEEHALFRNDPRIRNLAYH